MSMIGAGAARADRVHNSSNLVSKSGTDDPSWSTALYAPIRCDIQAVISLR